MRCFMSDGTSRAIITIIFGGGSTLFVTMLFNSPEIGISCAVIVLAVVIAARPTHHDSV